MQRFFRFLGWLTWLGVHTALLAALGAGLWLHHYWWGPGPAPAEATVLVARGDSLKTIAAKLAEQHVITSPKLFTSLLLRYPPLKGLGQPQAGEYRFHAAEPLSELYSRMVAGDSIPHHITVPEGLTSFEIIELLKKEPMLEGSVQDIPAEGSLLPDTYAFVPGDERNSILLRMREAMEKFLKNAWPKHNAEIPVQTVDEAVIVASIVEKETGLESERPRIAAVFLNRLKKNMPLQADPTVIYGITKGKNLLSRELSHKDLGGKTDYNTYVIPGLPPTAIANPGRAAIEAVLNPAPTEDIFFVATGNGGHAFSHTLKEHNARVAELRAKERERQARKNAPVDMPPSEMPETDAIDKPATEEEAPVDTPQSTGKPVSGQ